MKKLSNRKTISVRLVLSSEDYDTLSQVSDEVGLKRSEYLRAIIQGIGLGRKVENQIIEGKDVNIQFQGYGFSIPTNVMENLLQSIGETLLQGVEVTELEPKNNLRKKRMKTDEKESK
jgi:hypothetical protein